MYYWFVQGFQLFKHCSQVMVLDRMQTIDPDRRTHSNHRFFLQYCKAGPSGSRGGMADYNLSQRTNFNFLNFKPTRIICISNIPQNMTQDWIRRQMKEHYGNDVVARLQGTSWDILFCNVSEATTALALSTKQIGMDAGFQHLFSPRTALPLYKQYSNNSQR